MQKVNHRNYYFAAAWIKMKKAYLRIDVSCYNGCHIAKSKTRTAAYTLAFKVFFTSFVPGASLILTTQAQAQVYMNLWPFKNLCHTSYRKCQIWYLWYSGWVWYRSTIFKQQSRTQTKRPYLDLVDDEIISLRYHKLIYRPATTSVTD